MKNRTMVLFVLALICVASASTKSAGNLSACGNGPLFIDSMQENFGQYITTEIMAQNLKLNVTTAANKAVFVMKVAFALGGFRNTAPASIQLIAPHVHSSSSSPS